MRGVAGLDAKTKQEWVELLMSEAEPGSVRVLLFAALSDQAGWQDRTMPLAAQPVTALQVWQALGLGPWSSSLRVAINQTLVEPDHLVQPGDELAFLPPFTGG